MTEVDELTVHFNNRLIPDDGIGRTASSDRSVILISAKVQDGRSIPCIFEEGRTSASG